MLQILDKLNDSEAQAQHPSTHPHAAQTGLSKPLLPPDLELCIIEATAIPSTPCIPHYFQACSSPWNCKGLSHETHHPHLPSATLLSINTTWRTEIYKHFFRHNTFIFNTSPYTLPQPHLFPSIDDGETWDWEELRDPHATRLLDFVDRPEWRGVGSRLWNHNFRYGEDGFVDRYRHSMRSIALVFQPHGDRETGAEAEISDWDWMFQVDWAALPCLEELYLDFSCTAPLDGLAGGPASASEGVREGAERMGCLRLRKLVLMNVCPEPWWADRELLEERLRRLFSGALEEKAEFVVGIDHRIQW